MVEDGQVNSTGQNHFTHEKLRPKVRGKVFFIPSCIHYALPLSEKQFAGPFPPGSYIESDRNLVFGIHWTNVGQRQTDLDLSLLSATKKIGWDGEYRNDNVLFSGDVTDAPAPQGATELFYLRDAVDPLLVLCNYYNHSSDCPVTATLIVSNDSPKRLDSNYLVDPNKIVAQVPLTISNKQNIVGLVQNSNEKVRYYVSNVSIGCAITSAENETSTHARNYLSAKFTSSSLNLIDILEGAGAKVVREQSDGEIIDLSPENLSQSRLINLLF